MISVILNGEQRQVREGSIAGELNGQSITQENIMTLATGVNDSHHQAVSHE